MYATGHSDQSLFRDNPSEFGDKLLNKPYELSELFEKIRLLLDEDG